MGRNVNRKLSRQQEKFVEAFLRNQNAVEAARIAGYNSPETIGPTLIERSSAIQLALKDARKEVGID